MVEKFRTTVGPVPVDPDPDLLNVPFGPRLLAVQVGQLGFRHRDGVFYLGRACCQAVIFAVLGQGAPPVVEPGEFGV